MRFLKEHNSFQMIIVVVPFMLIVGYLMLLTYDVTNIFDVVYTNRIQALSDDTIVEVVKYSKDDVNHWTIETKDGERLERNDVKLNITLRLHKRDKDTSYYSESKNTILTSVDGDYILNILWSNKIVTVLLSWILYICIIGYACYKGDFKILSNKRILFAYTLTGLVGFMEVALFYTAFNV